jgi:hypothetical protein
MPKAFVFISHRLASILLVGLFTFTLLQSRALGEPSPDGDKHDKPYALIFMTVWGPDNRPLYGVRVKVRLADQKKAKWEGLSDHRGEFALRVPAGKADYVAWADVKGYKFANGKHLQAGDEVTVHIDNDERADIGLHLK